MSRQYWTPPYSGFPWAAFGMGRRGRFFEAGEIRLALLSLLRDGPKHGYQLMKELEERSGGMYKASAGSVYPTLQQLEDEGLVEATVIKGRRTFKLVGNTGAWEATKHYRPERLQTGIAAHPERRTN